MGAKKATTIVRVLTYLLENQNESDLFERGAETCSPNRLQVRNDDWEKISIQYWEEICKSVPKEFYDKKIQRFAHDLGLKWPDRNWDSWTVKDCLAKNFSDLERIRGLGKKKRETIARVLIHLTDLKNDTISIDENDSLLNHPIIRCLKERERKVFETRLLTAFEKPTLDELGQQYKVTRERIRQIERNILKRITASGLEDKLRCLLKDYIASELLGKYTDRGYVLKEEISEIVSKWDPELTLAVSLNHKSVYTLLSTIATEAPQGWFFGRRPHFKRLTKQLERVLDGILPCPTDLVAAKLEIKKEELIAASILNKLAFPAGPLLLPQRAGRADATRAAQCFEQGTSTARCFWSIDALIKKTVGGLPYHTQRAYRLSISRCRSLFLTTPHYLAILDHSSERQSSQNSTNRLIIDNTGADDETAEGNNVAVLRTLLEEQWPITNQNILTITNKVGYQTTLSKNSLMPLLPSIPGCVRLAPGVYGPTDYLGYPSRIKKSRSYSCTDSDIRSYCFARRSGEKCEELFPLWDAEQEQLWYRKIRKRGDDSDLLRSFSAIADQSKWPDQQDTERLEIMELKVDQQFTLEPSWIQSRSYRIPDLCETLTALRYARDVAPLSWIRANYITGARQLTEESGVSVLMCGLVLGLLDRKRRAWWKPIPAATKFDAQWNKIQSLFLSETIPDWNSPMIRDNFSNARSLAKDQQLGFIKLQSLNHFLEKLMSL